MHLTKEAHRVYMFNNTGLQLPAVSFSCHGTPSNYFLSSIVLLKHIFQCMNSRPTYWNIFLSGNQIKVNNEALKSLVVFKIMLSTSIPVPPTWGNVLVLLVISGKYHKIIQKQGNFINLLKPI